MQRDHAGLVELGVPHDQHAIGEISIATVETDRFADPHPGHREQADDGLVGRDPQR